MVRPSLRTSIRLIKLSLQVTGLFYSALFSPDQQVAYDEDVSQDSTLRIVQDYLALDVSLADLYANLSKIDSNFVKQTSHGRYSGIRVLKQDPWETLVW
jgi:N-glycosylase/DNA lyase